MADACSRTARSYHLFRYPILFVLLFIIYAEFSCYVLTRQIVNVFEFVVAWTGHKRVLRRKMRRATTWKDWVAAAKEMDAYLGFDAWKAVSTACASSVVEEGRRLTATGRSRSSPCARTGGRRLAVRLVLVRPPATLALSLLLLILASRLASRIRKVRTSLRTLRAKNDVHGLVGVLEVCLRPNFGGIERVRLYSETFFGTKALIEGASRAPRQCGFASGR